MSLKEWKAKRARKKRETELIKSQREARRAASHAAIDLAYETAETAGWHTLDREQMLDQSRDMSLRMQKRFQYKQAALQKEISDELEKATKGTLKVIGDARDDFEADASGTDSMSGLKKRKTRRGAKKAARRIQKVSEERQAYLERATESQKIADSISPGAYTAIVSQVKQKMDATLAGELFENGGDFHVVGAADMRVAGTDASGVSYGTDFAPLITKAKSGVELGKKEAKVFGTGKLAEMRGYLKSQGVTVASGSDINVFSLPQLARLGKLVGRRKRDLEGAGEELERAYELVRGQRKVIRKAEGVMTGGEYRTLAEKVAAVETGSVGVDASNIDTYAPLMRGMSRGIRDAVKAYRALVDAGVAEDTALTVANLKGGAKRLRTPVAISALEHDSDSPTRTELKLKEYAGAGDRFYDAMKAPVTASGVHKAGEYLKKAGAGVAYGGQYVGTALWRMGQKLKQAAKKRKEKAGLNYLSVIES